ncbi:TPA: hypothetical protein N0F65_006012, partial [Lagenidium giganteum]
KSRERSPRSHARSRGLTAMSALELRFPRQFLLRSVCAVYWVAFASISTQIRGLYGEDGLEPVHVFMRKLEARNDQLQHGSVVQRFLLFPTLVWLAKPLGWAPSFLMDAVCLVGTTVAALGVCRAAWRTTVPMTILWLSYLSIALVGQTFMSFQWDAFLLEVGFLCVWLAPWWPDEALFATPCSVVWTLRFLFFKFMLMSGCVKIQARCPTWLGLTALEYHYATQPLPLPLAWFVHQLPPALNRIAVAVTLLIEGPWTFFILAPPLLLRQIAAVTQIALQIPIMLTGNYNFFNVLTTIMALACLDVVERPGSPSGSEDSEIQRQGSIHWAQVLDHVWTRWQTNPRWRGALGVATLGYCVYSWFQVFEVVRNPATTWCSWNSISIRFIPTVEETQAWIARVLPLSIAFAAIVIVCSTVLQMIRFVASAQTTSTPRWYCGLVYLLVTSLASGWVFCSSTLTLSILDRPFQHSLPPFIVNAYTTTEPFRIVSAYGLFRRMTGVGSLHRDGKVYSVVARPELIIEGTNDGGMTWLPYHFRYKPGDVAAMPRRAMPFQPRLDWQMWFAALGDYQGAPWIVHLVDKLLEGSPDVKALLDPARDPFPSAPPDAVRVHLHYYDFTRWNTAWARENPNAAIIEDTTDGRHSHPWWTRSFAREYLPAVERHNPSVRAFLDAHEWGKTPAALARCPMDVSLRHSRALCEKLARLTTHNPYASVVLALVVMAMKQISAFVGQHIASMWKPRSIKLKTL